MTLKEQMAIKLVSDVTKIQPDHPLPKTKPYVYGRSLYSIYLWQSFHPTGLFAFSTAQQVKYNINLIKVSSNVKPNEEKLRQYANTNFTVFYFKSSQSDLYNQM